MSIERYERRLGTVSKNPQRATQGFVGTVSWTLRRPTLTLIEILWRWLFGIPALWLVYREGSSILTTTPWQRTGINTLSVNQLLTDPERASATLAAFAAVVLPAVLPVLRWLAPLLLIAWIIMSSIGRTLLLQRMNPTLLPYPWTMLLLQTARLIPLLLMAATWWFSLQWLAKVSLFRPMEQGGEPEMMVYVGGAIVLSLGLFVAAAAISWIFSAAPILAMRSGTGAVQSLTETLRLRHLRSSLFEINMVLSVVKIMLLVLAMAFSAFPLPFASVITPEYIAIWSLLVSIVYFAASDFFHVARLSAYVSLLTAPK